jgi:hypothetical protein
LDFDGVLHPLGSQARRFERAPELLRALSTLDELSPRLVLSTSWRFQPWETLRSELDRAAHGLSDYLEGRTGLSPHSADRRKTEIELYMASRPSASSPCFIALDDQPLLFGQEGQESPSWLLRVNPSVGLVASGIIEHARITMAKPPSIH